MPDVEILIPKKAFLPCYYNLLDLDTEIDLLYGGRDSGKSYFVAEKLIVECLRQPYFRCALIRKVFNSIKESMWQTIKDIVTEWGIEHLFTFSSSPLEIRCINGNRFTCRGMDDPGNIKSIAGHNYCWVEEGNQLTQDDFVLLLTSLRYKKVRIKTYITFNPEIVGNFEDNWLYSLFYSDVSNPYVFFRGKWEIEIPGQTVEFTYSSTHTTYRDNENCSAGRIALYERLKVFDPYHYNVYTLGKWHNLLTSDPFCYCFDRKKHASTNTTVDPRKEVRLSFDFNVNPITCAVFQSDDVKTINCIEAIKLNNSDIYKLCDYINERYSKYILQVTGDATGKNTSALVQDGINYYTVIKNKLDLNIKQLKVPSVNPIIKENRVLVNAAFSLGIVHFDKDKCKDLVFDCENVSVDQYGDIDKGTRSNPKKRADFLDCFRYYLNTFHKDLLSM